MHVDVCVQDVYLHVCIYVCILVYTCNRVRVCSDRVHIHALRACAHIRIAEDTDCEQETLHYDMSLTKATLSLFFCLFLRCSLICRSQIRTPSPHKKKTTTHTHTSFWIPFNTRREYPQKTSRPYTCYAKKRAPVHVHVIVSQYFPNVI